MNRNIYRRIHDGAPVTEDEALDAFGILKSGYGKWVALPLMMKDGAPSQNVTLSDSDIAYEQMKVWDANAWRNTAAQSGTYQADSGQTVQLGDAATEWAKMVEFDQNAWKKHARGGA